MCAWVHAVDKFERVSRVLAPKQEKARAAKREYKDCMIGLQLKQAALKDIMDQFEELQNKLGNTRALRD